MNDYPALYRGSLSEAKKKEQIPLWKDSLQLNIACKQAIEEAIRRDFDGMHLQHDCVEPVIREFGFVRTAWVLANTIQQKDWDGRFSPGNWAWARQIPVPDESSAARYVVESHPAILDGFVSKFREIFQRLGLFGAKQCEPDSYDSLDYEGKVLILSPDIMRDGSWSRGNQLWLALDGPGCSPGASDKPVRCVCLWDDKIANRNRSEFIGALTEEYLPNWAREKLEQLRPSAQEPQLSL